MLVLECASCGAQYPADFKRQWGKTQQTQGYGPTMCCVALVPSSGNPADTEGPREVCQGALGALEVDSAEKVTQLTPIGEVGQ